MIEAPSYEHQNRPRELVSSNGFSVEYDPIVTDQELRDDIVSYLGEYRFKIPRYDYELEFSDGAIRDVRRGEAMSVKAARSVRERMMRGNSINREAAEASGLNFLDQQLSAAEAGDSIVWASPPGEVSDGYGNYGFFFIGQIKRSIENRKQIEMTALRVEKPTMEGYAAAFKTFTDIDYEAKTPEDYLKFPVVVKKPLADKFVIGVLSDNFPFKMYARQQGIFDIAMEKMAPQIDEFIDMVKWAPVETKRKAFHALENYSIKIKKELEGGIVSVFEAERKLADVISEFGSSEPPRVAGSCPIKSNNPFMKGFESLNKALELENEVRECEECKQPSLDNHYHCPGCSKRYSDETSKSAEDRTKECSCGFEFGC